MPTGHFLHPPRLYASQLSAYPFLYLQVQKIFYHSFSPLGAGQELRLHDTHTSFMWLISTKQLVYSRWRKHSPRFTAQWGRQRDTGVKLKLKAVSANRGQEKGSGNTRELSECSSQHRIRTYILWEQGLKGEKTYPSHVPTGRIGPRNTLSILSQRSPWGHEKWTWTSWPLHITRNTYLSSNKQTKTIQTGHWPDGGVSRPEWSTGRQGARLAGKLLFNKPAALLVPISLAALATMCCNCGTSSLPHETVSWSKGCILSICLYHSAQTELKPNLISKLIRPYAWLGCNQQSPGPIIPNTLRCLVHLVLFFLISHSSSPGLCLPILSFYPPKATPILTLEKGVDILVPR